MEKLSILTADLLDILFEYRNKMYGAYELRKTYPKRVVYAITGTVLLCMLFVGGAILAKSGKKNSRIELAVDYQLDKFVEQPKPVEPPPVLPKQEMPKLAMSQYTPPRIVQDDQVTPEDEIKEVEKLEDTKIGTINQEGIKDDGIVAPPVEKPTGIVAAPKVETDYDHIFYSVQMAASFPGGTTEWIKYLERHLNKDVPNDNGAPAGKYPVIVSFTVAKDGSISDVKAENDPGYGTKDEAVRVIRKGPNWQPAEQNGHKVIYRHRQTITFVVE